MKDVIVIWSDIREKSLHQRYIALDYVEKLEAMGFNVVLNQSRNWDSVYKNCVDCDAKVFILHGGKIFPSDTLKKIYKTKTKIYLRWRWHNDPPIVQIENCHLASKVSHISNDYGGKLFYSPHPAITKYFYPFKVNDSCYRTHKAFFVGLAGKRGNHFYKRSGRNNILESKQVRYLNKEMFGAGNTGFYDYEEIAKYYNAANMVLSVSSFDDEINFRVFNAMACKTIIISDCTPAMDRFFTPNVDYISFDKNSVKDFESKVTNFMGNRKVMEDNAYKKIMEKHSSAKRLKEALERLL